MELEKDWKKSLGFPVNFKSDPSSEDDVDNSDVMVRRPLHSDLLLADHGDGAEADLLGTTPPRERHRDKNKQKKCGLSALLNRCEARRPPDSTATDNTLSENRIKKRQFVRKRVLERDSKQDGNMYENRADSVPSPDATPAVPTLVESCNRFMSLTSRLKCREVTFPEVLSSQRAPPAPRAPDDAEPPASRAAFHNTFSMLINMGNMDKGCRRTISREEQVWQNELKDLIWLELQARIAGRTLAQQDAFLCAQRNVVPSIVQNIRNYRFVNVTPCEGRSARLCVIAGSSEDLTDTTDDCKLDDTDGLSDVFGCLSFNCPRCISSVGQAMREVGTLLESYYNATTLYPSSKAMTAEHPLIATQLFKDRLKAMCLWYNTALHLRLKMQAARHMLRTVKMKSQRRGLDHLTSTDSDVSRQSDCHRQCQVRFNVSNQATPTDSSNSDSSAQSEGKDEPAPAPDPAPAQETDERGEGDKGDQVDNGSLPTPEIVISDSRYGTNNSVASNESGYVTSSDHEVVRQKEDVYELGPLDELTNMRLLGKCEVSPYRVYHQEMLKTQGVRRCMMFMNKMRLHVLDKITKTLEKPDCIKTECVSDEPPVEVFDDTRDLEESSDAAKDGAAQRDWELRRYGCWSEECLSMRLPSYRNHFLLLSSICMEAMHDYLTLRLEDRPEDPSCLTVKQLIHELKEGLDIATETRVAFARNIEVALAGHSAGAMVRRDLLLLIRTYDATVETVLKQYLSYLKTMSLVEHMPRHVLQAEWTFTARLAKRGKCVALLAPVTFSEMACNQLSRLLNRFKSKFDQLEVVEKAEAENKDRHVIYAICRAAQSIYASEREATLQSAQWARALAGRLARAPPPAYTAQRADIFNNLMSIRDIIVEQTQMILERSRVSPEELATERESREYEFMFARVRELLLQVYRLGFDLHKELYKFAQAPFRLIDEKYLKRQRPSSLQPVSRPLLDLRRRRPETMLVHESVNPMIHKELHRFVNDASQRTSGFCRRTVQARGGRPRLARSESIGEEADANVFDDKLFENMHDGQTQSSIELLLSGEPAPEEVVELRHTPKSPVTEEERQWDTTVARAVIQFARCWMQFVLERCDTGRGRRPRWASQGLEFLMLACDPCNTKHLSDVEFECLKKEMDACISHVIGTRPAALRPSESSASTPDTHRRRTRASPLSSVSGPPAPRDGKDVPAPPPAPSEPDPLLSFHGLDHKEYRQRVCEAARQLDDARDRKLRAMKAVGHVLEAAVATYEPKLRQVNFKWQRGLKIGAGTFGKVYTVVNTGSGQLLAMKELSIGAGDRRALQRAANELRVLEGVIHPHLVRYYGCELHREEMLIFMELCVEGSLEALVATSGALDEQIVRRYTKQLLSAVHELHTRGIAHRDIKSGNIFLTNEGHCLKLGDFGCAVKIRANTTAAGELQGHVGTQAYMAPEVFMKSSGHGRAADIWSLGCVVAEMGSGKRPFSEYDSNYQIMFVVGMGGRPGVPESLSAEGQQFCVSCLTHEPEQRPRAVELMSHHFLMVKSDDDCRCEPAYLL